MPEIHQHYHVPRKYGCFAFLLDIIMLGMTGGLWGIWIVIRQIRNR